MSSGSRDIEYLLGKYKTKQPCERWTREHETDCKRGQRSAEKHELADVIMIDLPLADGTNREVHYLIDHYTDFNRLHSRLDKRSIIACLCFYVMKSHNNRVRIGEYRALLRLGVDYEVYSTVLTNMLKWDNLGRGV